MRFSTHRFVVICIVAWVAWPATVAAELRTWTDVSGAFKKSASFEQLEGDVVFLRLEDGSERRIPLNKLSKSDQEYVKAAAARHDTSDPFEAVADGPTQSHRDATASSSGGVPFASDSNIRVVTVEGVGVDVASAKSDAYREAVRQVVGAFVDSASLASNDQLIEDKVITLSSAFVEKSEPIKETPDGRLVRVRLRAHVRVNKLLDSLKANKISTLKVDAESLVSQAVTKADQAEGMDQLIKRLLPELQKTSLRVVAEGKPEIKSASGDDAELAFWLRIEPQREAYIALATKLDAAFSAAERPSGELVSPGTTLSDGGDFREHLRRLKTDQAEYFLPTFFAAEADGKRIKETLGRDGASSIVKYEPIYAFSEPTASPSEWGNSIYLLEDRVWAPITRSKGELIVLLLVHANETGARTRWKWFKLTAEEADLVIANLKATMRATAVLKDKDGEEIARESVVLRNVGVKQLRSNAIVISPFFMIGDHLSDYIPSIATQRSVRLLKSEVSSIQKIDAFVQEGDPLVVYGR